ncbi:hypothetical protein M513_12162, partial [Trichuris suis]
PLSVNVGPFACVQPTYGQYKERVLVCSASGIDGALAQRTCANTSRTTNPPVGEKPENEIVFHILPQPAISLTKVPANVSRILVRPHVVRASSVSCTVAHIRKYLLMRATVDLLIKADSETSRKADKVIRRTIDEITIFIRVGDELIPLSAFQSMNILTMFTKYRRYGLKFPLEFYYYYHNVSVLGRTRPASPLGIIGMSMN